ncbi:SRPBCC family protein [Roseobacteraceae bacterium S113]
MNRTVFNEVIHASKDLVWDVLFHQYGDIHIHNPTMVTSNYLNGGTKGEQNAVRHCKFSDKLFLDEQIVEVNGSDSFRIEVIAHNLPFVAEMAAIYEVTEIGPEETEVSMTSFNSFSPNFMRYMMRGQMARSLRKHLFGMKHYAETGESVTADNYASLHKQFA